MIKHNLDCIGQIKTMGCWAAAFTMMYSWKANSSQSIKNVLKVLGQNYENAFEENAGLSKKDFNLAVNRLQLSQEPPFNPTKEKWLNLISDGPLLVIVDENSHPDKTAVHARVVLSIENDSSNVVIFNDPAGNNLNGSTRSESLSEFVKYYEDLADSGWIGLQIIHY